MANVTRTPGTSTVEFIRSRALRGKARVCNFEIFEFKKFRTRHGVVSFLFWSFTLETILNFINFIEQIKKNC